jgi:hypothetical protein
MVRLDSANPHLGERHADGRDEDIPAVAEMFLYAFAIKFAPLAYGALAKSSSGYFAVPRREFFCEPHPVCEPMLFKICTAYDVPVSVPRAVGSLFKKYEPTVFPLEGPSIF